MFPINVVALPDLLKVLKEAPEEVNTLEAQKVHLQLLVH